MGHLLTKLNNEDDQTKDKNSNRSHHSKSINSGSQVSFTPGFQASTENSSSRTQREFHKEEQSTYWLPKDEDEQLRLTGQHFALKELFGGYNKP
ncbi:hypothetical protein RO3G_15300 [Rhizopus delemar RA 99-880]|uniref:Uncharacterized protein n=1 Tax=Rhizopus delemar (strain RA 99-880 / ATCC MYA-4621 / FGSC 9543 / NRRL 43880) TaxID=246409 RepID=I1CQ59_RHIO9|nr:hypothetical protein RO3G_15300 [Rhizopus delemar RA 99-880]|eukprot:EIE90589.1 hypothetical protein RO3G_15300 [Rhizopus delemar RA 99-880]